MQKNNRRVDVGYSFLRGIFCTKLMRNDKPEQSTSHNIFDQLVDL